MKRKRRNKTLSLEFNGEGTYLGYGKRPYFDVSKYTGSFLPFKNWKLSPLINLSKYIYKV